MEDRHIIKLLYDRAEGAIEALAQKFGSRLYACAMNILGDHRDAQECVNDTYLALWNTIPPQRPDPLSAYAYRVGRNTALKRLRENTAKKRNSAYDLSLDELADCIPDSAFEDKLDARVLGKTINTYLDTVSRNSRVLFLRRYWFGDSAKDIALAMNMTENAVNARLSRIRSGLKDYLNQEGFAL